MKEMIVWKGLAARRDRIMMLGLHREEDGLVLSVMLTNGHTVKLVEGTELETVRLYTHGMRELQGLNGEQTKALEQLLVEDLGVLGE